MKLIFVIFIVISIATVGRSLHCYHCKGTHGELLPPETCTEQQTIETCPLGNYTCGRVNTKRTEENQTVERETKRCVDEGGCHELGAYCAQVIAAGVECNFTCNASSPSPVPRRLRCYECNTTTLRQCGENQTEVECPLENDRCVWFYRKQRNYNGSLNIMETKRYCGSVQDCNSTKNQCDNANVTDEICRLRCCSYDLCNAATPAIGSGLLLVVSFVFGVMHF